MKIHNKLESIRIIKELHLNTFPEKLFSNPTDNEVKKFLKNYPADYYAIRSKEIVDCPKNNFKVPKNQVLNMIKEFSLFTINVSSYNFTSNLVLIGDIKIGRDNEVWFIGSTNQNYTGKMAEKDPEFNFATDIFDKKLNQIPSFDLIYGYIVDNKLIDIIVEFAIYDKPVGINREKIVIFELRTEF